MNKSACKYNVILNVYVNYVIVIIILVRYLLLGLYALSSELFYLKKVIMQTHACLLYVFHREKIDELERIYFTKLYEFLIFKLESDSVFYIQKF